MAVRHCRRGSDGTRTPVREGRLLQISPAPTNRTSVASQDSRGFLLSPVSNWVTSGVIDLDTLFISSTSSLSTCIYSVFTPDVTQSFAYLSTRHVASLPVDILTAKNRRGRPVRTVATADPTRRNCDCPSPGDPQALSARRSRDAFSPCVPQP